MPKPINLIVACSENRVIGIGGGMPWSIPEDTAFFQAQTRGHTVIMGSHCFTEWPSAAEGRDVIIITHDPRTLPPGIHRVSSLHEAIARAQTLRGEIYLCGGQRVYEEGLVIGDRLYLTLVHAKIEGGDTFFPDWRAHFAREIERKDTHDDHWRYSFLTLVR